MRCSHNKKDLRHAIVYRGIDSPLDYVDLSNTMYTSISCGFHPEVEGRLVSYWIDIEVVTACRIHSLQAAL